MKRRLLVSLLVLCMVLTLMPGTALAVDGTVEACPVTEGWLLGAGYKGTCEIEQKEESAVLCTREGDCPAEAHEDGCPRAAGTMEEGWEPVVSERRGAITF